MRDSAKMRGWLESTETTISPKGDVAYWSNVWRQRELLLFLVRRDLSLRYKQALLGVGWAVLKPLATLSIYVFIFSVVAKVPSIDGVPYSVMVFAGLILWLFFANAVNEIRGSVSANSAIISKVYFPRIIVPLSALALSVVELSISSLLFAGLMLMFQVTPDWRVIAAPGFILLAATSALGLGLICAALDVRYRDIRYIVPFALQLGFYASPVVYHMDLVPDAYAWVLRLNPMVGAIEGVRWSVLGTNTPLPIDEILWSFATSALFLTVGVLFFKSAEKSFGDHL